MDLDQNNTVDEDGMDTTITDSMTATQGITSPTFTATTHDLQSMQSNIDTLQAQLALPNLDSAAKVEIQANIQTIEQQITQFELNQTVTPDANQRLISTGVTPISMELEDMVIQRSSTGSVMSPLPKQELPPGWVSREVILGVSHISFVVREQYTEITAINEGGFGVVASAKDTTTGELVAIKKIRDAWCGKRQAKCTFRELRLLRFLNLSWAKSDGEHEDLCHENIVGMLDCFMSPVTNHEDDSGDLYIVMQHGGSDLNTMIQTQQLEIDHIKWFAYQIVRGLKYVHSAGILHRDLKPSNIACTQDGDLKILDFGLARLNDPDETASTNGYIQTRNYRGPEVALTPKRHTSAVDMWSFGVLLGEMLMHETAHRSGRKPRLCLFNGRDMMDTQRKIAEIIGAPSSDYVATIDSAARTWLEHEELIMLSKKKLRITEQQKAAGFVGASEFEGVGEEAMDLLEKLLTWNPDDRLDAETVLTHPFFEDYHDPSDEPKLPIPFDDSYEHESNISATEWRARSLAEVEAFAASGR